LFVWKVLLVEFIYLFIYYYFLSLRQKAMFQTSCETKLRVKRNVSDISISPVGVQVSTGLGENKVCFP